MEELKPCPFCGGKAYIVEVESHTHMIGSAMISYNGGAFVECSDCTCAISADTKAEAIEAWNRRAKNGNS